MHSTPLEPPAEGDYPARHLGSDLQAQQAMLASLGLDSLEALVAQALPADLRHETTLGVGPARSEQQALADLRALASQNRLYRSYIGMGYHDTWLPTVIRRNVLENPAWYSAYTPYQPELAQGRLEALLNFQQLVMDLTGLPLANASLLDEATAAAEAMALARRVSALEACSCFFVAEDLHPQTLEVVRERARYLGVHLCQGPAHMAAQQPVFGALLQYPATTGAIHDLGPLMTALHARQAIVCVAADPLALVLLTPPGELGADVVVGSSQRFGVPMGYGGPHAAYFATREAFRRAVPGRLIGVSRDVRGQPALRMALQTREQHIRREKANSNICTAQVLLANLASFYAVYHGPEGLARIAGRVQELTSRLAAQLRAGGRQLWHDSWFDTLTLVAPDKEAILVRAEAAGINVRRDLPDAIGVSLDETTTLAEVARLAAVILDCPISEALLLASPAEEGIPARLRRQTPILTQPVFRQYHTETELLRYIRRLERKDMALDYGMIPLGSCTMKLNASSALLPLSWPEFAALHPFVPLTQAAGYQQLQADLQRWLCQLSGFQSLCLQPNSGAQGEYAGLLSIRRYLAAEGQAQRDVCLIPSSAHGTNPASARMAGLQVVTVSCDRQGNIDRQALTACIAAAGERLACLMVTYPSTHGVFEADILAICAEVHAAGGQVYLDGANLNALVGLSTPAWLGADVSHFNLHKTFAIPHGGGGPGMGPIGVRAHLAAHVPGHLLVRDGRPGQHNPAVAAAPFGSASLLPISWMYLAMLGDDGLRQATRIALLNANYVAARLSGHYPVLYRGPHGRVAHECIVDVRPIRAACGITEVDVAKRLMDYGFHAPTIGFPVPGTLMIEPTESESKVELDRFIEAMLAIREEIARVEQGHWPADDNPLVRAPHTQADLLAEWQRPYARQTAFFPTEFVRQNKFWPTVNRLDEVYGDRHLCCGLGPPGAPA